MRWYWRADVPTIVVDSLLEGSLVGVVYLALVPLTAPATQIPLVAFWLSAAAGLAWARLSSRRLRLEDAVPGLVVLAGVAGFWADGGAGVLLGVALLRGALHVDSEHESDVSVDAVTYALPVIAFALLMHLRSGAPFVGLVLIASLICLVAGMVAVGRGRQREFELVGPVAHGKTFWPLLGVGLAVWTAVAVPVAYVVGTVTLPVLSGPGRSIAGAGRVVAERAAELLSWLVWQLGQLLPVPEIPALPTPVPVPSPSVAPQPVAQTAEAASPFMLALLTVVIVALSLAVVSLIALLCLVVVRQFFGWRRARARTPLPEPPPSLDGYAPSPLERARSRLTRRRPQRRKAGGRSPASAAEAYLALLDDLVDLDGLARAPTETPLDHAHRVGDRLDPMPLALLAADYQLASYGQVEITDRETARALARWRRLRDLAQRSPGG